MNIIDTKIADVKIIEPRVFGDERGFFLKVLTSRFLIKQLDVMSILFRTIIRCQKRRAKRTALSTFTSRPR